MINMSFVEKIKYFINMLSNNINILYVIAIFLILTTIILIVCRKNNNLVKEIFLGTYFVITISIIIVYYKYIISLFSYLINNIVANLLFPNIAIYMGILLIIDIIVIFSLLSSRVKYYVKSINIVYFIITQLFLYLIINNVIRTGINVYEKSSIYANQDLSVLIQLSMQLFIVWIIVLMVIEFVNYLMGRPRKTFIIPKNELVVSDEMIEDDYNKMYDTINELIEYVPIKKIK